jgi:hypothetical protein
MENQLIGPGLLDSIMKLRVVLVFSRHPMLRAGVAGLGQRLPGNHWALEEALDALAEAGIVERRCVGAQWEYALASQDEVRRQVRQLAARFDDPHGREEIYRSVREAEQERRFRDAAAGKWRAVSGDAYETLVV